MAWKRLWYRVQLLDRDLQPLTGNWSNVADATVENWFCSCGDNDTMNHCGRFDP